ncbi:hypothetical protein LZL87_007698 [Fusarium oxysporum]|nr:hypothetical protein LZL87_007698 [Fusarium oxysporum]
MTLVKAQPPFNNGHVKNEAKAWAQNKLSQMTLEEKVLLLTGEDLWRTNPIPRLGVSRINSSDGPCAFPEHHSAAANDQETRRFFIDEKIPDRALREIALQLFQIVIRDIVILGRLDLEMPGPVRRRGKHLIDGYRKGLVDLSFIDASASRVLELVHKVGKSNIPDWKEGEEKADDLPEHRATFRRAGAEAHLAPHYHTTPYEWIKPEIAAKLPTARVQAHAGILTHRYSPFVDPAVMMNPGTGNPGFQLSLFRNMNHCDQPFMVEHRLSSNLVSYDGLPPELTASERYSYRGRAILKPKTTGLHEFSLFLCGSGKLMLDGEIIIDIERHWWSPKSSLFMSYGSSEERVKVYMEAGREYELGLESISREPEPYDLDYIAELEREEVQASGRIGFMENPGVLDKFFQDDIDMARGSDIAIIIVGKDHEWETETSDMVSMDLPGRSNEFISAVAVPRSTGFSWELSMNRVYD